MVGDERQGWALFAAMAAMFLAGVTAIYAFEAAPNPAFAPFHLDSGGRRLAGRRQHGGQGGALRRRPVGAVRHRHHRASDGAVNAMHDSFMPLSGLVPAGQHDARTR
jgi:K+-transporting ATPase ATPase A chain